MAKFKYRMQSLYNVKIQLENSAKNELGIRTKKLVEEQERLDNMYELKNLCMQNISRDIIDDVLDILKLRQHQNYLNGLKIKIEGQKVSVKNAAVEVEKSRQKLIEAAKEKKMLEKLKEKKFEEYRYEELKQEEKVFDELISYKHS